MCPPDDRTFTCCRAICKQRTGLTPGVIRGPSDRGAFDFRRRVEGPEREETRWSRFVCFFFLYILYYSYYDYKYFFFLYPAAKIEARSHARDEPSFSCVCAYKNYCNHRKSDDDGIDGLRYLHCGVRTEYDRRRAGFSS